MTKSLGSLGDHVARGTPFGHEARNGRRRCWVGGGRNKGGGGGGGGIRILQNDKEER